MASALPKTLRCIGASLLLLAGAGCGQTGPLYLPQKPSAAEAGSARSGGTATEPPALPPKAATGPAAGSDPRASVVDPDDDHGSTDEDTPAPRTPDDVMTPTPIQ
jgi:predicted small lipoprotein YifL